MTKQTPSPQSLPASLQALMSRAKEKTAPPVDKWHPEYCGELDIQIAQDGTWYYLGSPIGRKPLVELFASVLRKDEDGQHYLVTPVEKIGITVEDAPFLAVEMASEGDGEAQKLTVRTNVGDVVLIGPGNPLRFEKEPESDGLKPYVLVRGRLEALFTRALMYQLVDLMVERASGEGEEMGVWSDGGFFAVPAVFLTPVEP